MNTWIALLRGINVGGSNVLRMKDLVTLLEKVCCSEVKTYLESGNAVFKSAELSAAAIEAKIELAIKVNRGFETRVVALSREQLGGAIASNPFPQAEETPTALHLFFLSEPPHGADVESLTTIKADSESFVLTDRVFYLQTPEGFGRSKLARRAERLLGVDATARNWRTVSRVWEMAKDLD